MEVEEGEEPIEEEAGVPELNQKVKGGINKMSKEQRGIRDGTGSYKDSYRRKVLRKVIGTRKEEGEDCPFEVKEKGVLKW